MRLSASFRHLATGLALTTLGALAACSSSTKDAPAPQPTPAGMSWTVDGTALSTTNLQSQKYPTTISVAGTVAGANSAYLLLEFPNAVGTYTFGPTAAGTAIYSNIMGTSSTSYFAGASGSGTVTGAGTIVVTALTATNVTGTFTFTGISSVTGAAKSISNGKFNVGL